MPIQTKGVSDIHDPRNNVGIHSGAHFDGATYSPVLDHIRLTGQLQRVFNIMKDGHWRSLRMLSMLADCPEASASARLRDLRKEKFGAFQVDRKRFPEEKGLFLYKLVIPVEPQGELF